MISTLLKVPPKLSYCGITIELEFPSRHDKTSLCSGAAAYVLKEAFEGTGISRYNCEIRVKNLPDPYLPGTKVVLLAGETAIRKIGQEPSKINALRGSPFPHDGIVYIPTYHPQQAADIFSNYEKAFNPQAHQVGNDSSEEDSEEAEDDSGSKDMGRTARRNYRFWAIHDIRKAVRIAKKGFRPNNAVYHTNLTGDGILNALARTTPETPFYLDIETSITTGQIICFAWSNGAKDIYVAPILGYGGKPAFTDAYLCLIFRSLADAMSKARVCVLHNALFDLFILSWRYKIPPPLQHRIYDTMVAHARMFVDVEKSLGHCTSLYTDQPYHKDEGIFRPSNAIQFQQLLTYNAKDVETTALVHEAQCRLAEADSGLVASIEQGNSLVRPLLLKSLRGLYLDKDKLCARCDELREKQAWIEANVLPKLSGSLQFNPRSPKQVCELLYEKFNLPRSSDPRMAGTGKKALYKLALKWPLPILKTILYCRARSRELGTLSAKLWRDSHTTCSYVITGTKTFRLSSRKLLGVWGTNVQNWSKKMRQLVIARPGHSLIQVDQSGAEALIVAYLAGPGRYRDLFINKVSPHVYFGIFAFPQVWKDLLGYDVTYLWPMTVAQVKQDSKWAEISRCIKATDENPPATRYYYLLKQTNHSANYDITEGPFVSNILEKSEGQISLPQCEGRRLLKTYHGLYPEIRGVFQHGVKNKLYKTKLLRNMFGYPRRFFGDVERDPSILKDALSWIPQSSVGVITGKADSSLQARIDAGEYEFSVWQNNHDSLLSECKDGNEETTARVVSNAMNIEMISPWGEKFSMRSEASIGKDWYNMTPMTL